jgi:hypothetical protein
MKTPPRVRPEDLLIAPYRWDGYEGPRATPAILYLEYTGALRSLIDSMQNGMAERVSPDSRMAPRRFTLYRLRDHAKTTITDLGYGDFSEWYLAHSGSTYYQQTEKKRAEIFAKIEPSLTYLDTLVLESNHADMESRLEQSQEGYRRLADELRLQRQQTERLEQELKPHREELEQENRFIEFLREVLHQHTSSLPSPRARNELVTAILEHLSELDPMTAKQMEAEILRFVEGKKKKK